MVLERLQEAGFLPAEDVDELRRAYRFLRALEHRIQALDDEQTQRHAGGSAPAGAAGLGHGPG
ncbi:MAG: hypothetical protein U5R48_03625 [Gammaproteobacteria bacterium]|nr:hypothetical protein [Gammaproteobacteria bacterium]